MANREYLSRYSRDELINLLEDAAKNWLAHDGLWFLALEEEQGIETALRLDAEVWARFSAVEARRILRRLGTEPGGGIPVLAEALRLCLHAHVNTEAIEVVDQHSVIRHVTSCRVQELRQRKGLPTFACKPVGIAGQVSFARTIDPRLHVRCLAWPPDAPPADGWCMWEYTLVHAVPG